MTFETDLEALRTSPLTCPERQMKMRHERRGTAEASLAQTLAGNRSVQRQVVALYDLTATKGARPVVVAEVSPLAQLDNIEPGATVTVRGWPAVGRAVALQIDGSLVEATYPCVSPLFRPMRFK